MCWVDMCRPSPPDLLRSQSAAGLTQASRVVESLPQGAADGMRPPSAAEAMFEAARWGMQLLCFPIVS